MPSKLKNIFCKIMKHSRVFHDKHVMTATFESLTGGGNYTEDRIVSDRRTRLNSRRPEARASCVDLENFHFRCSKPSSLPSEMLLRRLLSQVTDATISRLLKRPTNPQFLQLLLERQLQYRATSLWRPRYQAEIFSLAHMDSNSHIRRIIWCRKCFRKTWRLRWTSREPYSILQLHWLLGSGACCAKHNCHQGRKGLKPCWRFVSLQSVLYTPA